MDYKSLEKEDFDAIVTGELTHYAIWFEGEIINIITDHFLGDSPKRDDFNRLLLLRDGLTFQDKIEIVRGMIPLFQGKVDEAYFKKLLKDVENFKSLRNALSHGREIDYKNQTISVELVNRAGKQKIHKISPTSHEKMLEDLEGLLSELKQTRKTLQN
jgi:hypothetical protein